MTPAEQQKAWKQVQDMGRVWSLGPLQDAEDAARIGISVAELLTLDTTTPVSLADLNRTDELRTRVQVLRWALEPDNRTATDRAGAARFRLPLTAWLALPWAGRDGLEALSKQRWAIAHPRAPQPRSDKPRKARADKLPAEEAAQRQRTSKAASQKRNPEAHRKANAAYKKKKRLERKMALNVRS